MSDNIFNGVLGILCVLASMSVYIYWVLEAARDRKQMGTFMGSKWAWLGYQIVVLIGIAAFSIVMLSTSIQILVMK